MGKEYSDPRTLLKDSKFPSRLLFPAGTAKKGCMRALLELECARKIPHQSILSPLGPRFLGLADVRKLFRGHGCKDNHLLVDPNARSAFDGRRLRYSVTIEKI